MSTGIFDIIGPNMIGPSSSHTAGALRIAYLAGRLIHGGAKKVEFTLYGSFAHTYRGHGTDRALLAGVMGFAPDDLRIRDSFQIAQERGLQYSVRLRELDGVEIDLSGEYDTIVVKQYDKPGVVAFITKTLSESGVNIAFMRLYRENRGKIAYTIVEADQPIHRETVRTIFEHPDIVAARRITPREEADR